MPAPVAATATSSAFLAARRAQGISFSFSGLQPTFPSFRLQRIPKRLHISCSAKQETVDRVCQIVKNQLALAEHITVTGDTKFVDIGADSLDTVEIVMGLEEAFQISVDESSAQVIQTVDDAASLIDKLVAEKDDDA